MIAASVAGLLAALAVGVAAPPPEPPPMPIDWDGTAVPFTPFYAFTRPGGEEYTVWAIHPQEGRDICAYQERYAELGPLNCWVEPVTVDENGNQVVTFGPDGLVTSPDGPPAIEITVG